MVFTIAFPPNCDLTKYIPAGNPFVFSSNLLVPNCKDLSIVITIAPVELYISTLTCPSVSEYSSTFKRLSDGFGYKENDLSTYDFCSSMPGLAILVYVFPEFIHDVLGTILPSILAELTLYQKQI